MARTRRDYARAAIADKYDANQRTADANRRCRELGDVVVKLKDEAALLRLKIHELETAATQPEATGV